MDMCCGLDAPLLRSNCPFPENRILTSFSPAFIVGIRLRQMRCRS